MHKFFLKKLSTLNSQLLPRKGFTLIEMLVTIALIATLATIAFGLINPAGQIQKSRDLQRKSDLAQIQRILEQYYNDVGRYPTFDSASYTIKDKAGNTFAWNSPWPGYMDLLPKDPTSTQRYIYYSPADGQSYYLYAHLERGSKDSVACTGVECTNVPGSTLCGNNGVFLACNYGVASPNVSP